MDMNKSNKNRADIAKLEMVPKSLLSMALMLTKVENKPSDYKKAYKDQKKIFLSAMSSHLICYANLDILTEKYEALKEEMKALHQRLDSYERQKMVKQMQEKEES